MFNTSALSPLTTSRWIPVQLSHGGRVGAMRQEGLSFHLQLYVGIVGVSESYGYLLGGPNHKDYNILGSILGSPYFGKLPSVVLLHLL